MRKKIRERKLSSLHPFSSPLHFCSFPFLSAKKKKAMPLLWDKVHKQLARLQHHRNQFFRVKTWSLRLPGTNLNILETPSCDCTTRARRNINPRLPRGRGRLLQKAAPVRPPINNQLQLLYCYCCHAVAAG
jgi:hypothetical protein